MSKKERPIVFDFLESINYRHDDIMTNENEKHYVPFVINRFLSGTIDTLFVSNTMNECPHLDKKLQYDFLRLKIRKKFRRVKWLKRENNEDIETIQKYYGYSEKKAREVFDIIGKDGSKELRKRMAKGGLDHK